MALPLLPGHSFNRNMGKEKFHKSQHWGFCNNVRMLGSEDKPGTGIFIRRHRISLPPPDEDQFYTVHRFNINIDIVFYGRTFKIYDCDTFTKNFLKKIGVRLNPPGQCPEDPYLKTRREKLDCMEPLRPYESFDTLKQFLECDRKVLRFFCLWDDSGSVFGDHRELILHYFLSDKTIEIKGVLPHNSGRDATSLFLQRRKVPKYGPPGVYQPGQITDRTVLNVDGGLSENRVYGCLLDKYKRTLPRFHARPHLLQI